MSELCTDNQRIEDTAFYRLVTLLLEKALITYEDQFELRWPSEMAVSYAERMMQ